MHTVARVCHSGPLADSLSVRLARIVWTARVLRRQIAVVASERCDGEHCLIGGRTIGVCESWSRQRAICGNICAMKASECDAMQYIK